MLKIINTNQLWFGWSFIIPIIVFVLNGLFLLKRPFPDQDAKENQQAEIQAVTFKSQPKIAIEGVCFIIYGFISQATFYLISQFIGIYGEEVAQMTTDFLLLNWLPYLCSCDCCSSDKSAACLFSNALYSRLICNDSYHVVIPYTVSDDDWCCIGRLLRCRRSHAAWSHCNGRTVSSG